MTDADLTVAIAAFQDRSAAARAVSTLQKDGFKHQQIGIASRSLGRMKRNADVVGRAHVAGLFTGLITGLLLGAAVGAAAARDIGGMSISMQNGAVLGAVTGAVLGLILGAITGMGIRRRDPAMVDRAYDEARTVVTVAADKRWQDARSILRRCGGIDVGDGTLTVAHPVVAQPVSLTGRPQTAPVAAGSAPVAAGSAPPPPPPARRDA